MKFNLCRIVPDNNFAIHANAFHEIEASIYFTLQKLGYEVSNSVNQFSDECRNIIFGFHNCPVDVVKHLTPKDSIIYNLEQVRPETNRVCRKLLNFEVWDYSQRNIENLKNLGVKNIKYVPIGFVPELSYFQRESVKDIDVLFFGSINERRAKILEELKQNSNLNLVIANQSYGEERDKLLSRSKMVLNLHNHDTQILEMVRVSHLIQNRVPVLCERNEQTEVPDYLNDCLLTAPYEKLVETTLELVSNTIRLEASAAKAIAIFEKSPMENFVKVAV